MFTTLLSLGPCVLFFSRILPHMVPNALEFAAAMHQGQYMLLRAVWRISSWLDNRELCLQQVKVTQWPGLFAVLTVIMCTFPPNPALVDALGAMELVLSVSRFPQTGCFGSTSSDSPTLWTFAFWRTDCPMAVMNRWKAPGASYSHVITNARMTCRSLMKHQRNWRKFEPCQILSESKDIRIYQKRSEVPRRFQELEEVMEVN